MGSEPGADLVVVRRPVIEVGVVIVQRQEVNGDLRRDRLAGVQNDRIDGQVREDVEVVRRLRDHQLVPGAPHGAGEQLPADVDLVGARVLKIIVRVPQAAVAVSVEAVTQHRVVHGKHAEAVGHPLAVLALAAGRLVDHVMPILVVHHALPRGVRISISRDTEVDGAVTRI